MCLILFAWRAHPRYPLIVAANRDEFHERPTLAARFWTDAPNVLAGRDLRGGGTWLGVTTSGRFAALTNFREPGPGAAESRPSRGALVAEYLLGGEAPGDYAQTLARRGERYDGFNLLLGTPAELFCVSNRGDGVTSVQPGIHALSNHLLDTDWPKAVRGRARLFELVRAADRPSIGALLEMLDDRAPAAGDEPGHFDRAIASEWVTRRIFIESETYGTRSSTALCVESSGRVRFAERTHGAGGTSGPTARFEFLIGEPGGG